MWVEIRKTEEMVQVLAAPAPTVSSNGEHAGKLGAQVKLLTGLALMLSSCMQLLPQSQHGDVLCNWVTPETAVLIQSALSEMENLMLNTSDLQKTWRYTSAGSLRISAPFDNELMVTAHGDFQQVMNML